MMTGLSGWSWKGAVVALGMLGAAGTATAAEVAPLDPPQDVKIAYVPILKFATAFVAEYLAKGG